MPNPMRDNMIRKLVTERLEMIRESEQAYIIYNGKEEKIMNVELKETENFARIMIITDNGTVYVLTPAEFLRKTIRTDKKVMRGR